MQFSLLFYFKLFTLFAILLSLRRFGRNNCEEMNVCLNVSPSIYIILYIYIYILYILCIYYIHIYYIDENYPTI